MKQNIGVVGLGAMGKAIASNLLKAGFHTTVWNRSPEPVSELVSQGAVAAKNVGDAALWGPVIKEANIQVE